MEIELDGTIRVRITETSHNTFQFKDWGKDLSFEERMNLSSVIVKDLISFYIEEGFQRNLAVPVKYKEFDNWDKWEVAIKNLDSLSYLQQKSPEAINKSNALMDKLTTRINSKEELKTLTMKNSKEVDLSE